MIRSLTKSLHKAPKLSSLSQIRQLSAAPAYKYTLDNDRLSKDQRDFYEENGYIMMKKLVSEKDIKRYWDRFAEYATGKRKPESPELILQKELAVKDAVLTENSLYKIQELYADEVLFEYCKHPKVLEYVSCFTGPNIMAIHTMLINKPPDTGSKSSRHPLHQDLHYFPVRPAERIVCAWTAMERITPENGCLVAIPGTHKGEHLSHDYPEWEGGVNKFYYGVDIPEEMASKRVHLLMEPGDCVLFHPLLIHGSGVNKTKGFRKAISCHYAPYESNFIDVNGTIQQKMADEILETFNKKLGAKLGMKINYEQLWKLRARTVAGNKGWEVDFS